MTASAPLGTTSKLRETQRSSNHRSSYIRELKGGPGTGKSTLMRSVVSCFRERNPDMPMELFWCSGAVTSLDGVYLPQIGVSIVDGSQPHCVEPELPGAAEEIDMSG